MACPLCGHDCHCSWVPPRADAPAQELRASVSFTSIESESDDDQFAGAAEEQFASAAAVEVDGPSQSFSGIERHMQEERALDQQANRWRDEVANKIESYKQKRARKRLSGDFSMRFDFEQPSYSPRAAQAAAAATAAALAQEPVYETYEAEEQLPSAMPPQPDVEHAVELFETDSVWAQPEPAQVIEARVEPVQPEPSRSNLIEFPRLPFMYTPSPDELAEPVFDRPRILDVPEEVPSEASPLSDIRLEADEQTVVADIEVPLQVAPAAQRFVAAVVDWAVVLGASAGFLAVAWKLSPGLVIDKLTMAAAGVAPLTFWAVYHFLFLVYCGRTPGMSAMRLSALTFDGTALPRSIRKWRALTMVLSCMPLGLGFAWALADEDMLCWHDRITRTYVTNGR